MNTGATNQVLMTPRSSPVYPKQEVVLEEPIPEWGSMIPKELGSRNDIFCFDYQICCALDQAYPHIITQYFTITQYFDTN